MDNQSSHNNEHDDYIIRGLLKKHEDHVRVLEALIYSQETLINVKDAQLEELVDSKQQLQNLLGKLHDNQQFFDEQAAEWEQERQKLETEILKLKEESNELLQRHQKCVTNERRLTAQVESLKDEMRTLKHEIRTHKQSENTSTRHISCGTNTENDELLDLSGRLQEALNEKERVTQLLEGTTQENVELRQLLEELQREIEASELNKVTLQQQIELLRQQLLQRRNDEDERKGKTMARNDQVTDNQLPLNVQRLINIKAEILEKRGTKCSTLVQPKFTLPGNHAVYGMALLGNELFVVRWECYSKIEVYDVANDYSALRCLTVTLAAVASTKLRHLLVYLSPASYWAKQNSTSFCTPRFTDIAASCHHNCLYVSDLANCTIHRLHPEDGHVTLSWPVEGGAYGLSETQSNTLLVCCTGSMEIIEYSNDGVILNRIVLPRGCVQPWHTIQLARDANPSWIVCHGGRHWNQDVGRSVNDPLHRIYKIGQIDQESEQAITDCENDRWHGCEPGSRDDQVCYPLYMVEVDKTGYFLVADCDNNRVKLLNEELKFVKTVLGPEHQIRAPQRLALCMQNGHLIVGLASGIIHAYKLKLVMPKDVSALLKK